MFHVKAVLASIAIFVLAVTASFAGASIQVDAASNMQTVFGVNLIPLFTKQTGIDVDVTYGATGLLAKQMENGAPIDVFLSADDTTVRKLGAKGFLDAASEQPYATGQLAVVLRPGFEARQASLTDLQQTWVTKVAIADPAVAPYGKAAVDALTHAGVYDTIVHQDRLLLAGNVGEAYLDVSTGNVDAAVTALSLVINAPKAHYSIVPLRYYTPISQTLGLAPHASDAAQKFAAFLTGAEAQAIFKQYGYLPPKPLKKK